MLQNIKDVIKRTQLYTRLRFWITMRMQKIVLNKWENQGKPVPPPHAVKQRTIKELAERFGLNVLVETGTYYGDMVAAMKGTFDQIYSIELSKELYEKAKKRFKGDGKIEIIHGDSGIELGTIIGRINHPALFWLDGHYSAGDTAKGEKDTPIYEELTHIFNSHIRGHVIIIDDARCFGVDSAYPRIEEISDFIKFNKPDAMIEIENDSIRITPNRTIG